MSRRSAPRQPVTEIWRTSSGYGTTLWHHRLACGHIEVRKRRAPADEIGCVRCEAGAQVSALSPVLAVNTHATLDIDAAMLRIRLATAMQVPLDTVTVQIDVDRLAGAMVFLDPEQIASLLRNS